MEGGSYPCRLAGDGGGWRGGRGRGRSRRCLSGAPFELELLFTTVAAGAVAGALSNEVVDRVRVGTVLRDMAKESTGDTGH